LKTDVEADVRNIVTYGKKKIVGKKIHVNIPPAPMDNVKFHSKESVQKWKYVYQKRITHKRELSQKALKLQEGHETFGSCWIDEDHDKSGKVV
jgi:hypothetical protein